MNNGAKKTLKNIICRARLSFVPGFMITMLFILIFTCYQVVAILFKFTHGNYDHVINNIGKTPSKEWVSFLMEVKKLLITHSAEITFNGVTTAFQIIFLIFCIGAIWVEAKKKIRLYSEKKARLQ